MKLHLIRPKSGDKDLIVIDEEGSLSITIDYDDVDHDTVLRATKELIRRVNSFNEK
jgi:hypothetical protein